jgi:hypothetical protein
MSRLKCILIRYACGRTSFRWLCNMKRYHEDIWSACLHSWYRPQLYVSPIVHSCIILVSDQINTRVATKPAPEQDVDVLVEIALHRQYVQRNVNPTPRHANISSLLPHASAQEEGKFADNNLTRDRRHISAASGHAHTAPKKSGRYGNRKQRNPRKGKNSARWAPARRR